MALSSHDKHWFPKVLTVRLTCSLFFRVLQNADGFLSTDIWFHLLSSVSWYIYLGYRYLIYYPNVRFRETNWYCEPSCVCTCLQHITAVFMAISGFVYGHIWPVVRLVLMEYVYSRADDKSYDFISCSDLPHSLWSVTRVYWSMSGSRAFSTWQFVSSVHIERLPPDVATRRVRSRLATTKHIDILSI